MKKCILILIFLIGAMFANAQVLNKTQLNMKSGDTYIEYVGTAQDTLTANQDSILFPVFLNQHNLYKTIVGATFLRVGASDTIVKMAIWGRNFESESWTYITSANTIAITSTTVATQKTINYGTALQYRFLRVHFMRPVPAGAGTKVKLTKLEVQTIIQ